MAIAESMARVTGFDGVSYLRRILIDFMFRTIHPNLDAQQQAAALQPAAENSNG